MRVRHYERKDRRMTNSTPDTPHTSPTKLAAMKLGELRAHARKLRIEGADELHKPELLAKVKEHRYAQAHGGKPRNGSGGGSTGGGGMTASADQDRGGSPTPDTPDVSETKPAALKVDEQRAP